MVTISEIKNLPIKCAFFLLHPVDRKEESA